MDIDAGRLRHEARCIVGDLANEWLEAVHPNRKASTFSNWERLMRAYVVRTVSKIEDKTTTSTVLLSGWWAGDRSSGATFSSFQPSHMEVCVFG